jgi:predicted deacetylase
MTAQYIIRFDDFCPTMNWTVWEQLEVILFKHHIKPIIAVVPDNQDPKLAVNPPNPLFWTRVRAWQAAGWTIAIHGHQHVYSNSDSGLMKFNNYSEFAGLPYEEQYQKLATGLAIFAEHQVKADAWIAPAHSFDANTIKALVALNIKVISDGFYFRPVTRKGVIWIPTQVWRFKAMSYGLWTVCKHHNSYSDVDIRAFESDIEQYEANIISFDQAVHGIPANKLALLDIFFEWFWQFNLRFKSALWPVAKQIKKILKR